MNSPRYEEAWLDGSLYPDQPVPDRLETSAERTDYVARVCAAWDFGILPRPATLRELTQPEWRAAVEEARLLTSSAYHLLRELHGLPPAPYLGARFPDIEADPCLAMV